MSTERLREAARVHPEYIIDQRIKGWPDIHPEDYCHRCGAWNMTWCADAESWIEATSDWAKETGREGICCLNCFVEMHHESTGESVTWSITKWTEAAS